MAIFSKSVLGGYRYKLGSSIKIIICPKCGRKFKTSSRIKNVQCLDCRDLSNKYVRMSSKITRAMGKIDQELAKTVKVYRRGEYSQEFLDSLGSAYR